MGTGRELGAGGSLAEPQARWAGGQTSVGGGAGAQEGRARPVIGGVLALWGSGGPGQCWGVRAPSGGSLQSRGPDGVTGSSSVPRRWPEPRVQEDPDVRPQEAGPSRPGRGSQARGGGAAGARPARGPQPVLQALRLRRPQAHGPVSLSARRPPRPGQASVPDVPPPPGAPQRPWGALSLHPRASRQKSRLERLQVSQVAQLAATNKCLWCPPAVLVLCFHGCPLPPKANVRNCRGS